MGKCPILSTVMVLALYTVVNLVFTPRASVSELEYLFKSIALGKQNGVDRGCVGPDTVGGEHSRGIH